MIEGKIAIPEKGTELSSHMCSLLLVVQILGKFVLQKKLDGGKMHCSIRYDNMISY